MLENHILNSSGLLGPNGAQVVRQQLEDEALVAVEHEGLEHAHDAHL